MFSSRNTMNYIEGIVEEKIKDVTLDILRKLIRLSPVDTGRYRNNHVVSKVNKNSSVINSISNDALNRGESEMSVGVRIGKKVYIQNNLPYSEALEFGHSDQAPSGVYRVAIL